MVFLFMMITWISFRADSLTRIVDVLEKIEDLIILKKELNIIFDSICCLEIAKKKVMQMAIVLLDCLKPKLTSGYQKWESSPRVINW